MRFHCMGPFLTRFRNGSTSGGRIYDVNRAQISSCFLANCDLWITCPGQQVGDGAAAILGGNKLGLSLWPGHRRHPPDRCKIVFTDRYLLLYVRCATYFYWAAFSMSSEERLTQSVDHEEKPLRSCRRSFMQWTSPALIALHHSASDLQASARHNSAPQTFTYLGCGLKLLLVVWLLLLLLLCCNTLSNRVLRDHVCSETPSTEFLHFLNQDTTRLYHMVTGSTLRLRQIMLNQRRRSSLLLYKVCLLVAYLMTDLENGESAGSGLIVRSAI